MGSICILRSSGIEWPKGDCILRGGNWIEAPRESWREAGRCELQRREAAKPIALGRSEKG